MDKQTPREQVQPLQFPLCSSHKSNALYPHKYNNCSPDLKKLDYNDKNQAKRLHNIKNKVLIDKQQSRDNRMYNCSQWYKNCIKEQENYDKLQDQEAKKSMNKKKPESIKDLIIK